MSRKHTILREYQQAVTALRRPVYSYAYYYLRNRDDAEDITQEVLLRLWQHWETVESAMRQPWTLRVTRNACLDHLRRRKRTQAIFQAESEERPLTMHPGSQPDPERSAAQREVREQVEQAIALLPEPHKSIVILREIQELKYDEICAALNLPMTSVKVYLHRGRKMLRNRLQESIGYESG